MTNGQDYEWQPREGYRHQDGHDEPWHVNRYDPSAHRRRMGAPRQSYPPEAAPPPAYPEPPPAYPRQSAQWPESGYEPGYEWPEPGYEEQYPLLYPPQPPDEPPGGPQSQEPWPARHKVLTGSLAFCAVAVVTGIVVVAGSSSSSSISAVSASIPAVVTSGAVKSPTATKAPAAAHTVTFEVTGSPADVTYGPAGTSLSGQSPMTVTQKLGTPMYYALQAQLQGGGSVTVKILVNGKVISKGTATGGYNIALAEVSLDQLSGQWTDTSS